MSETASIGKKATLIGDMLVEQRQHPRLSTNVDVQISWVDAFGFRNQEAAVVKNISAGGFGIEFSLERPVGSRLSVRTETIWLQCIVRHSQARQGRFYLGLEVLPSLEEATASASLGHLGAALSGECDEPANEEGDM